MSQRSALHVYAVGVWFPDFGRIVTLTITAESVNAARSSVRRRNLGSIEYATDLGAEV